MPTPSEHTCALIEAGSFLLYVSQEPEFPEDVRRQAQRIVNRLPSLERILEASGSASGSLKLARVTMINDRSSEMTSQYLTDQKQVAWEGLKKSLHLSTDEKTQLSGDFLTRFEMQQVTGKDEEKLKQTTDLKWFLAVPSTNGSLLYPRFQLQGSAPIDSVAEVFSLFERHADGWDDPWLIVAWFYRINPRLDGRTPIAALKDDLEAVVDAAAADLAVERLEL